VRTDASSGTAAPQRDIHRLVAFGLVVDCEWPLPGSQPADPAVRPSGPHATIRLMSEQESDAAWARPFERIFEPSYPDGETRFTVDRTDTDYRLWFSGFGRYLVARDGREIGCEIRSGAPASHDRRERFVFAQVLPLASVLQGFQLLHASAVCGKHGVAAFLGASGAGKTTLASRLVVRGAGFVTDDVLALTPGQGGPVAHPGPPFMAIPNHDRALIEDGRGGLGRAVGASDKLHASPASSDRALPLRAVFHLEPGDGLELSPLDGGDARRLLGSAFAPYLMISDRLVRHLEVTRQISATVAQFRLQTPRTDSFEPIVDIVEAKLRELAL
jgi:hypothetical protein